MADRPIIQVSGSLDEQLSKKQIQSQLDNISKSLKLTIGVQGGDISKEIKNTNKELSEESKRLQDVIHNFKTFKITGKEAIEQLNAFYDANTFANLSRKEQLQLSRTIEKANNDYTKSVEQIISVEQRQRQEKQQMYAEMFKQADKRDKDAKIESQRMEKYNRELLELRNNTIKNAEALNKYRVNKDQQAEIDGYLKTVKEINPTTAKNADELLKMRNSAEVASKGMRDLKTSVTASGKSMLKMSEYLKNAVSAFSLWSVVTVTWYALVRAIKAGIGQVVALDSAMLELRKVTDLSESSLSQFTESAKIMAQDIGRTTTEVTKATAAFARMGFEVGEAMRLAEDALLLTNIGDGIKDVNESADTIIATLKGFNLEASASRHVIDALNEVSNNYAVNTDDLAEGIKRVSAVMSQSGDTFDETLGLLTSMIEVMQDAPKAATALRTISMRLRGLEEDGTSLEANFTAKLEEDFQKIAGVSLFMNGHLKTTTQIVQDLGSRWSTLTGEEQAYLSQQVAGIRQAQAFNVLMTQYKTGIEATETAMNSQNSAMIENAKYLDSIEGKTARFNSTLENMWMNTINSGTIKAFIDLSTVLVKVIDAIGGATVAIAGLGVALVYILKIDIAGWMARLVGSTTALSGALSLTMPQIALIAVALGGLVAVIDMSTESTKELQQSIAEISNRITTYKTKLEELKAQKEKGIAVDERQIENLEYQIRLEEELFAVQNKKLAEKTFSGGLSGGEIKTAQYVSVRYKELQQDLANLDKQREKGIITEESYQKKVKDTYELIDSMKLKMAEFIQVANELAPALPQGELRKSVYEFRDAFQEWILPMGKAVEKTKELNKELREGSVITAENRGELNDLKETASDLAGVWQDVADGTEISGIRLLELLEKYPSLINYVDSQNNLTITSKQLEEELWEIEKQKFIDGATRREQEIKDKIESAKATIGEIKALQALEAQLNKVVPIGSQFDSIFGFGSDTSDPKMPFKGSDQLYALNKEISDLEQSLKQIGTTKSIVGGASFTSFTGSKTKSTKESSKTKDTAKEIDHFKKYKMAIDDLSHSMTILESKIKMADDAEKEKLQTWKISLLKQQQKALQSYSDAIRDRIKNEKLSIEEADKLNAQLKSNSQEWYKLQESIKGVNSEVEEFKKQKLEEQLKKQQEALEFITDLIEKQVTQGLKNEIELRKKAIEDAKKLLDLKLQEIDAEKTLNDYQKERLSKEKDLNKIIKKLSSLSTAVAQGDARAIAEASKLEEERAKLQEELDKHINDRGYELKKEGLEKQFKEFENAQNAEIKVFEDNLNNASYIAKQVNQKLNDYLKGTSSSLYEELINWNRQYGTGMDNDIVSKWQQAIDLVRQYNATLQSTPSSTIGGVAGVPANSAEEAKKQDIIARMKANSAKWHTASPEERKRLHEENLKMAESIGYIFNSKLGAYFHRTTGARLFDNGGKFEQGDIAVKKNAVPEWIMRDDQLKHIQKEAVREAISQNITLPPIQFVIEGSVTDTNVGKIANDVTGKLMEVFKTTGFKNNLRMR